MIDWRQHIDQRPDAMDGRPFFRGTALTVRFILERMADGWTEAELLDSYPRLTTAHLRAAIAYAADAIDVERQLLETDA